jgi:hypothetical protein
VRVDPVTLELLESLSINPRVGVKVTAAKIGITRVTLWSIRAHGVASKTTMTRIALALPTLQGLNHLNPKVH